MTPRGVISSVAHLTPRGLLAASAATPSPRADAGTGKDTPSPRTAAMEAASMIASV
jgi:hypothetical protein